MAILPGMRPWYVKSHISPIHPHILQVMDETEGWGDFRAGYGSENRKFLAASFPGTPWILASATLDDEAIASIATSRVIIANTNIL